MERLMQGGNGPAGGAPGGGLVAGSAATRAFREGLDEAGIPWSDLSSHHESGGTVAHYERTRVEVPGGLAWACWGYSSLGAQRGARVYASTAGYPDMLEFWADLGMGTFALSPGDAVEACAAMTAAAV